MEIDRFDAEILAQLQDEARLSMAELGRRVRLSQPAVTERVRKLEQAGVITGYHARVDPGKLGYGIRAIVRIGICDYSGMIKRIDRLPEIRTAYNVTGEDSWIMEIAVRDVQHLDLVLQQLSDLTKTATAVILRVAREHAPLSAPRDLPDMSKPRVLASRRKS